MRIALLLSLVLFINELLAQMPNTLTKTEKVYGLSKFWQEVNYNFIYLDKIDRDSWNEEYKRLITEVQETRDDYEYYRLLQKFCAMLKDGHTNVYEPDTIWNSLLNTNFGEYRLFLSNIEGKAIVTRTNLSKKDEIPIGTEITKVNGLNTATYLDQYVKPYISSSTDHALDDWAVRNLFRAPSGKKYDVELKLPNGKIKALTLTHTKTTEKEVYPPFEQSPTLLDFKWVGKNIAYVSLNSFSDPKIDTLFIEKLPELYKAKSLVIDLRNNGGGNTFIGMDILKYLTNDTILYGIKMRSRLHIPSYKAWGEWTEAKDTTGNNWEKQSFLSYRDKYYYDFEYEADTISEKIQRIVVPTVLLIGHYTASAAEDFLIYADNQDHMVKIGEPTFGSTGQPMQFDLPGGGSARVCTKKDTYPDGREFVGYGIQPDIIVRRTLNDYIDGNDPVLNKAIEYLKQKK
ncbi:MAG: peptidase S41 [Crocinitomicaceae bacterium]|nr:peptidase S41 [Crocinitomicaceae bacterium]